MPNMKIAINSRTTGKFRIDQLNGREHIVTEMLTLVGDSVMNEGLYPDDEVANSFMQLDALPAPMGHPVLNGRKVSAFHPAAVNAHNVGGFVRNPRKVNKTVFNEFWLDVEIANQSEDGKELIGRIESGGKVGVSTGLTLDAEFTNGKAPDGTDYSWVAHNMNFDHVAVLLHARAAGESDGTELQLNLESSVNICAVNDMGVETLKDKLLSRLEAKFNNEFWVWIVDVFPDQKQLIYELNPREGGETRLWMRGYGVDANEEVSLLDDTREVERVVTFEETGAMPITNYKQRNLHMPNKDDKGKTATPVVDPAKGDDGKEVQINAVELTAENCIAFLEGKGMIVATNETIEAAKSYAENQERFLALVAKDEEKLGELRKLVVENSDFTDEDVSKMPEDTLKKIHSGLQLKVDNSLRVGGGRVETAGDHLDSYTNVQEETKGDK